MKRSSIVMIALCLVLGACSKGTQYGANQAGCEKTKQGCATTTATAKPKKSPVPKKSTPKPVTSATATAKPAGPVHTWHIKIRDVANGYEPNTLRAYEGDIVIFENLDTATPAGHSWTGDNKEWDSGIIKPGKTWRWVIDIPPKVYKGWHDESVPYIVGGPLEVLARR